jgi:signal peptidase I
MSPAVATKPETIEIIAEESVSSAASASYTGPILAKTSVTIEPKDMVERRRVVRPSHHQPTLLQAIQSFLYIVVIALFIITFTAQPFRIPSESMEPTLLVGDFLMVNKEAASSRQATSVQRPVDATALPSLLAPNSEIHRGDLIVFHYPVDPALHLVKRVVGLPGDHIRLRDGHVFIDGRPLSEPYAMYIPASPDSFRDDFPRMGSADPGVDSRWWIQMRSLVSHGELTVPASSYFVLGDNRNDSEDSRYWGFVPQANIVGKPFLIYFSLRGLDAGPNLSALPNPNMPTPRHDTALDFARWDRALHIIR